MHLQLRKPMASRKAGYGRCVTVTRAHMTVSLGAVATVGATALTLSTPAAAPVTDLLQSIPPSAIGIAAVGVVTLAGLGVALAGGALGGSNVSITPQQALQLADSSDPVLVVDIRSKYDARENGTPKIKRRLVSLPFTEVDNEGVWQIDGFAESFAGLSGLQQAGTVMLLDDDGRAAAQAAATVASATQARVVYVKGGTNAWQAAGLPWRAPGVSLSLPGGLSLPSVSLPGLPGPEALDALAERVRENPSLGTAALALGAVAGSAVFIVNEFDTLLELAGVVGAANLVYKNLLFADDRERTLKALNNFLKEEVGAENVTEDLKAMARGILDRAEAAAATAKTAASAAAKPATKAAAPAPAPAPAAPTAALVTAQPGPAASPAPVLAPAMAGAGAPATAAPSSMSSNGNGVALPAAAAPAAARQDLPVSAPVKEAPVAPSVASMQSSSTSEGDVSPNAAKEQAQAWIEAWKAKNQAGEAAAEAADAPSSSKVEETARELVSASA